MADKTLLEETKKMSREWWRRKRSGFGVLLGVFIPSFAYFEDEKLREINSFYYDAMFYEQDKEKKKEKLKKAYEEYKKLLENEKDKTKRAVILNNIACLNMLLAMNNVGKGNVVEFLKLFNESMKETALPEVIYNDALEGKERKIGMGDFEEAMKEEKSAIELWKEQSKNYNTSAMFKELIGKERKEKKEAGMYG
ncbi:MAG: hypothetical protein QXG02_03750 [Candidatus Anstonellales archaeon]